MTRSRSTHGTRSRGTRRPASAPARRSRRAADAARERILAEAERALVASGPEGVRVAELARKLGITHPAILHHFGTREALLESVVARALERRYAEVVTRLSAGDDALGTARGLLEAASRAFAREGTSRLVAWLALGSDPDRALGPPRSLAPVAEAVDAVRGVAGAGRRGRSSEASLFAVHLGALLLLGEPVLGPAIWTAQGRRCTPARERAFHDWFTQLLSNALLEIAPNARRPAVRPRRR